jgi:superfamily II DNA or RNA helicase|nr:MAG TPA: Type I site specific restriction modification protein [Caudoviricetes sp.]
MFNLRSYQTDLISRIAADFSSGIQRVCAVAPCGAGKTVVVGWMAGKTALVNKRVLFLVHRRELIDQSDRTFTAMNIRHGIISAGVPADYESSVQIGSVQTVARRLTRIPPPDFIIIDEAHHAAAGTWKKIMEAFPQAMTLGVTATPARLDGNGLGDIFQSLVMGPSVDELIQWGNLSKYNYYAPPSKADIKSVRIQFGDYVKSELERAVDDDALVGDIVANYQKLADGRQTVCYCVSRKHSEHTAAKFRAAGISAAHVDGETHKAERDRIISDFRRKKLRVLCNVDLLGEGFDVPGMEAVILARPTASLTLFIQQSMRPLRPDPDNPSKVAVIIDHVGNCFRHGLPNAPQEWTLDSKPKKKRIREISMHQCPKCYQVWMTAQRTCPYCGYVPPVAKRKVKEEAGTLAKIDSLELLEKKRKRQEVGRARSRQDLEDIALRRGYKFGWVRKMMEIKGIRQSV